MKHVLFLHIPKTGGISIEKMIRDSVPADTINPASVNDTLGETDWSRAHEYRFFFTHAPIYVRDLIPKPVFTFTFLRHPLRRAISAYNHILRDAAHGSH